MEGDEMNSIPSEALRRQAGERLINMAEQYEHEARRCREQALAWYGVTGSLSVMHDENCERGASMATCQACNLATDGQVDKPPNMADALRKAGYPEAARELEMATDGQVEEKAARGPRPIETMREWWHPPTSIENPCRKITERIYKSPQEIPGPCDVCGEDGYSSGGIVERDANDGTIYRRDGKAVPREAKS
jgi:hypothetical protein